MLRIGNNILETLLQFTTVSSFEDSRFRVLINCKKYIIEQDLQDVIQYNKADRLLLVEMILRKRHYHSNYHKGNVTTLEEMRIRPKGYIFHAIRIAYLFTIE